MAKLTLELGATINTGEYSNVRPLVRISDIDPALDVAGQVADALRAAVEAFPLMDEELAGIAEELVTGTPGRDGLRKRIDLMEKNVTVTADNLKAVFSKVKNDVLPQLEEIAKRLDEKPKAAKAKKADDPEPPVPLKVTLVEEPDGDDEEA